jgi:2-oxoacid dehydrogenases acyltransferase (catalytic domain)
MEPCSSTLCVAGSVRDLGRNRKSSTQKASMVTDFVAKYITAVGMFGKGVGWGIPPALPTLMITLGGIGEKPGVVDGHIAIREYLSLTISFDHEIIDGTPAARFTESGYGLFDSRIESEQAITPETSRKS